MSHPDTVALTTDHGLGTVRTMPQFRSHIAQGPLSNAQRRLVLDQAEIATDVMFKTRPDLLKVWPDLVHHACLNMSSEDVLGFLGRKLHPSLQAQVVTDTKRRPEGWRVCHRMGGNWVKVYDKVSVLRVETTIGHLPVGRTGGYDA